MRKRLILAAVSLTGAIPVSAAVASTAHTSGPPPTVVITAEQSKAAYSPKTLTAPAGTQFLLVFKNLSAGKHNVSLEQGELEYGATITIGKGSTAAIFTLKKGVYHFYSSVGNDETAGLSGTLIAK
jgi:plastocyanin